MTFDFKNYIEQIDKAILEDKGFDQKLKDLKETLESLGCKVTMIHDEIVVEFPEDTTERQHNEG